MARRKHHTKKRHHSRRRHRGISGTGGGVAKVLEFMVAGGVGGWAAHKGMQTLGAGRNPKMVAGVTLAAAGLLALKAKNPMLQFGAIGAGTAAMMELGKNLGVIKGVGESNTYDVPMSGYEEVRGFVENPVAGVFNRGIVQQPIAAAEDMILSPFGSR